jgi:phosphatidylglycerol:prolipoprotein diacylglycerol transferase
LDKLYFTSVCIISGVIGSKFFFLLEDPDSNISYVLDFKNGFVFYGSLFGTILAIVLVNIKHRVYLIEDLGCLALASSFGMVLGKMGCFLAGCCYGYPSDSFFSLYFRSSNTFAYNPHFPLFPVQILDSILNLILFFILLRLHKLKYTGLFLFGTFGIVYSIFRFSTEFLRADVLRGFILNETISLSQFYSSLFVSASIILLNTNNRLTKTKS